jgi:hypothetical protein
MLLVFQQKSLFWNAKSNFISQYDPLEVEQRYYLTDHTITVLLYHSNVTRIQTLLRRRRLVIGIIKKRGAHMKRTALFHLDNAVDDREGVGDDCAMEG